MVLTSALPQTKDPKPPMCVCVGGGFCLYWTVTVEMDTKEREGGGKTHSKGLRVGLEPRPLLSGLTACGCLLNQNPRLTLRKLLVCLCNT